MQAQNVMTFHPAAKDRDLHAVIVCIQECVSCAQATMSCADACLAEPEVEHLRQCIRLNLDCADVCRMTAALASRRTGSNEKLVRDALELCARAAEACHQECMQHAREHEHCRICGEACRSAAEACREAMDRIGGDGISGTGMQPELPWIIRH